MSTSRIPRSIPTPAPRPVAFYDRRRGATLFFMLVMLAVVAAVGSTVFLVTRTDLNITANYKHELEAISQAEAGVHYVVTRVSSDLKSGLMKLDAPVISVHYPAPEGFNFDAVTKLSQQSNTNTYAFIVTGRSMDAKAEIEAVIRRRRLLDFGIFGDFMLDLKPYANVYSYDSRITPRPRPEDSNGQSAAASNADFITNMGTYLDGVLALGEDTLGQLAVWKSTGDPVITGETRLEVGRIEPDPLGAVGGAIAQKIIDAQSDNNNANVVPPITTPKYEIYLGNGDSMTLTAGDYYVENITLHNGAELLIDNRDGPVNIYLADNSSNKAGLIEAQNGSSINITGIPTDFAIYSNTSKSIILKNTGVIKGLIYAPYAKLQIMNTGDFFGVIWGRDAELKNSGNVFIDVALLEARESYAIALTSWKDLRY